MGFWFYIDFLVDCFFICDFVLNFFTGWMDVDRELLIMSFEGTSKVSHGTSGNACLASISRTIALLYSHGVL